VCGFVGTEDADFELDVHSGNEFVPSDDENLRVRDFSKNLPQHQSVWPYQIFIHSFIHF